MVRLDGRRRWLLLVVVLGITVVVAFAHSVAITRPSDNQQSVRTASDVKLVTVDPSDETKLWPFTSRQRRFETLTLPINLVVVGDAERVRHVLTSRHVDAGEGTQDSDRPTPGWVGRSGGADGTGERLDWRDATGARRYSYVHSPSPDTGGWVAETFQLQDGDYFGTRYHIRAYEGGTGTDRWTAIQAHHEHWDWFRLRHTVGSTARGQRYVERRFYGRPTVKVVERQRFANGGLSDADGWATVVRLSDPSELGLETAGVSLSVVVLSGLGAIGRSGRQTVSRLRQRLRGSGPTKHGIALGLSLLALPVAVRSASISAERAFPAMSPRPIAATGYLILAIGLPICAGIGSRGLRADESAPLAGTTSIAGFLLDYAVLGIAVLPVSVVVHRFALAVVLAVIAVGGSRWSRAEQSGGPVLVGGAVMWVGGLLWPLFDAILPFAVWL